MSVNWPVALPLAYLVLMILSMMLETLWEGDE